MNETVYFVARNGTEGVMPLIKNAMDDRLFENVAQAMIYIDDIVAKYSYERCKLAVYSAEVSEVELVRRAVE